MKKCLILAGGQGSRIKEYTSDIKPLVKILGKPIIEILIKQLKDFEIFININKEDYEKLKVYEDRVKLLVEDKRMGKAQPIREMLEKYNEDILVIHCDVYSSLDYDKFVKEAIKNNELMTMVVRNISKGKAFGVAVFDKSKKVYGFTRERYVNTGIYFIRKEMKSYIKENIWQDLDEHVFPRLIKDNQLKVYIMNGYWFDCGTQRIIEKFNKNKENKNGKLHK